MDDLCPNCGKEIARYEPITQPVYSIARFDEEFQVAESADDYWHFDSLDCLRDYVVNNWEQLKP